MRSVAGSDYDRLLTVIRWPLREVLVAFVEIIRRETLEQYRADLQVWAAKTAFGGNVKPPKLPEILR